MPTAPISSHLIWASGPTSPQTLGTLGVQDAQDGNGATEPVTALEINVDGIPSHIYKTSASRLRGFAAVTSMAQAPGDLVNVRKKRKSRQNPRSLASRSAPLPSFHPCQCSQRGQNLCGHKSTESCRPFSSHPSFALQLPAGSHSCQQTKDQGQGKPMELGKPSGKELVLFLTPGDFGLVQLGLGRNGSYMSSP